MERADQGGAYKDGKRHGPWVAIRRNGTVVVCEYKEGAMVGRPRKLKKGHWPPVISYGAGPRRLFQHGAGATRGCTAHLFRVGGLTAIRCRDYDSQCDYSP